MKKNTAGITIIEILIASAFVVLIFTGLLAGISVISSYVNESNIKLTAMNLAKSGVEKIYAYKNMAYLSQTGDKWGHFIEQLSPGYYTLSGANVLPNVLGESAIYDFKNWEGPLNAQGDKVTQTGGLVYYRLLKVADFDILSQEKKTTIFDCNIQDDFCNTGVSKKNLSDPYLSGVTHNTNTLELTFSTGNIFQTPSLFLSFLGSGTMNIASPIAYSTGSMYSTGDLAFLNFSGETPGTLLGKTLTLSGVTFVFGPGGVNQIPVHIGDSIDTAIFHLRNAIIQNLDTFSVYVFYPNKCLLGETFQLYDTIQRQKFTFGVDFVNNCNNFSVSVNNNKIILSGSMIQSLSSINTINPTYKLKFSFQPLPANVDLFKNLISSRVTSYGLRISNVAKGKSPIYLLGIKVIGVENGKIKTQEIFQTYLIDL